MTKNELLDDHGPFESIEALQAALDAWRQEQHRPAAPVFEHGLPSHPVHHAGDVAAGVAGAAPPGRDRAR